MKQTKVVNFYAGPGTGKSTTAAALFAELKYRGVNCEYVQEVAKWATWEKRGDKFFKDQVKIFAEQHFMMNILQGEVDLIITDSPIFIGAVYHEPDYPIPGLRSCMGQAYDQYDNLDILLVRNAQKPYNTKGRLQTEDEAKQKDREIETLMKTVLRHYETVEFNRESPEKVIQLMVLRGWHNTIPNILNV